MVRQTESPVKRRRQTYSREDPELRRQELIEATFRVLADKGYAGAGVRAIADEAGVSIGMIRHHFSEKQVLIAETYRFVSAQLQAASEQAADAAGTDPSDRLRAYLMAGFRPPYLDQKYLTARFILWGVALTDPQVRAVHDDNYGAFRMRLKELILDILPASTDAQALKTLAATVSALTDGLWIDWILRPEERDVEASVAHCMAMIAAAGQDTARP